MAQWTDHRRRAAKTLLATLATIAVIALVVKRDHRDWGNPVVVALGLYGAFVVLLQIVDKCLTVLFGWDIKNTGLPRAHKPTFASQAPSDRSD
jgi:hypothetical protein